MELALYCPQLGFYELKSDSVGRRGDFYTSVSTGSLFGELLAFQFAEWLEELATADCRLAIAEAGAHDGKLAADTLRWLREQRPQTFAQLDYVIHEPSVTRRAWQAETLREFTDHVRWLDSSKSETRNQKLTGIFFSNELFDAFPVHRLGWDAREQKWFEWGVACDGDFQLSTFNFPRTPRCFAGRLHD
jgi:SAM-dependent MidA family methyltransferase